MAFTISVQKAATVSCPIGHSHDYAADSIKIETRNMLRIFILPKWSNSQYELYAEFKRP